MSTIREMGRNAALVLLLLLCGCYRGRNAIIVLDDQWAVKQAQADWSVPQNDVAFGYARLGALGSY